MRKFILYNSKYQQLDNYLSELECYWKFEAFHHGEYPWSKTNPALSFFLDELSEQKLNLYQQYPEKLYPLLVPFIEQLRSLTDPVFIINDLPRADSDLPFWISAGIKGRKWTQIAAFANQVDNKQSVVEWCAGKGHLGRLIAWQNKSTVTSVEWQQNLCDLGTAEAKKMQLAQTFQQADVLKGEADNCIHANCHAVALHACGDLHVHLIELAKVHKPKQLSISPCCYHLTQQSSYLPCSEFGKKSSLKMSKQILKLAVSKQVTTGKRQSQLSEQEVWWRLAFDELQKHCLQSINYCPLPSFPKTLLSGEFKGFVEWAMEKKSLRFDVPELLQPFLDLAQKRLKKIRRMELVSQFFVRPLELWLVYDRVLALQESGYDVELSTFCDELTTPRNLLIQAEFKGE